jgi:enamine deaminase RidA (YjgF/YER057c/UK114 family)
MAGTVIRSEALEEAHPLPEMIRTGAFSAAVKAGPFIYVSGCIAKDLDAGMREQARELFEYIKLALGEEGYSLGDVVKLQAFITDVGNYSDYSEARKEYFPSDPPASTAVIAVLLVPGALVEIDAVAYRE